MKIFKKDTKPEMIKSTFKWRAMYENGGSLKLAAAIASELARLVTLEMKSKIYGSKKADILNEAYDEIINKSQQICEVACAMGGVMLKPYIQNGKLATSFIPADSFEVTSVLPDGKINGAKFFERIETDGDRYIKIEEHTPKDNGYVVSNRAFLDKNGRYTPVALSQVPAWKDLESDAVLEGISEPLFSYFKIPFADTSDLTSPLGAPVYSKATGLIEDAQKQYERLLWEFESGERALYIDETALRRRERGNAILPEKRLYRMLDTGNDELFKDWSPELREASIINGLQSIFQRIEFNCGLAYGTISDPQSVDKTAEEVRASRQRSYATVVQIQTALKQALTSWAKSADELLMICGMVNGGKWYIDFEFDDSIVADRKTEFNEKMALLTAGVITADEMRKWYLGESEDKNNE